MPEPVRISDIWPGYTAKGLSHVADMSRSIQETRVFAASHRLLVLVYLRNDNIIIPEIELYKAGKPFKNILLT